MASAFIETNISNDEFPVIGIVLNWHSDESSIILILSWHF